MNCIDYTQILETLLKSPIQGAFVSTAKYGSKAQYIFDECERIGRREKFFVEHLIADALTIQANPLAKSQIEQGCRGTIELQPPPLLQKSTPGYFESGGFEDYCNRCSGDRLLGTPYKYHSQNYKPTHTTPMV